MCSSVVEYLLSACEALASLIAPSFQKTSLHLNSCNSNRANGYTNKYIQGYTFKLLYYQETKGNIVQRKNRKAVLEWMLWNFSEEVIVEQRSEDGICRKRVWT